jgi:hypothetical protein
LPLFLVVIVMQGFCASWKLPKLLMEIPVIKLLVYRYIGVKIT